MVMVTSLISSVLISHEINVLAEETICVCLITFALKIRKVMF